MIKQYKILLILLLFFVIGCESKEQDVDDLQVACVNPTMSESLTKINNYRAKVGLNTLTRDTRLDSSASNHAKYISSNNIIGHDEDSSYSNYTGNNAGSRALYVSYPHNYVSENLATQSDEIKSLDALMSAIYHRFGFLNFNINQIGYGSSVMDESKAVFVYNMGNTYISEGCSEGASSGYIVKCGEDDTTIAVSTFEHLIDDNPTYIYYPYASQTDVYPAFYEEHPDPLPNHSLSGFPISIEFNKNKVDSVDSLDIKLYKGSTQLDSITLMDKDNDPNDKFSAYQFALFPTDRLDWDTTYKVKISYAVDGGDTQNIEYNFTTRKINSLVVVSSYDQDVSITSGQKIALYLKPHDDFTYLSTYSYSYSTDKKPVFEIIDKNTIYLTLTGLSGEYVKFKDSNDDVLFKATIQ